MVPIISFIGSSGSGKTGIMEKVVAELARRGTKVAVIKHSHHENLAFDKAGKDSYRYTDAGAETVVLSGKREMVVMRKIDHDLSPYEIADFIGPDVDLIITEGFKSADTPKIEVHRKSIEPKLLAKPEQLLAVVTDEKLGVNVPQLDFNKDNTRMIADLIENWLAGKL